MINIEEEIFNDIAKKVRAEFSDVYMVGEYVKTPPTFPFVSLIEQDNYTYTKTQTSLSDENHCQVMYEVNVFSNKAKGKKTECKNIMDLIDRLMLHKGFTRTMMQPIPNIDDATIYRIVARYTGVVSKDKQIFRR